MEQKLKYGKIVAKFVDGARLGNNMFTAAASYKIAKDNGYDFLGIYTKDLNSIDETDKIVFKNFNFIEIKNEEEWKFYPNHPSELNLNVIPEENIILKGYFQDAKLVDKNICSFLFNPTNDIKNEIFHLYGCLDNYVCVHVRRGDYLHEHCNYIFNTYNKANIENYLQLFPNDCKVLFVSDDIEWCKENFKEERYYFADKEGRFPKTVLDLYTQTQCGLGNIVSNGTFGWWGGYLNESPNKKVVVHCPWFKNPFSLGCNGNQIIPNDWIKVYDNDREDVLNVVQQHFNNEPSLDDLTTWCAYDKDEQVKDFNLIETKNFKLFKTTDTTISGKSINDISRFFCEGAAFYYVWKNKIYSEFVAFSHYRRLFRMETVDLKKIKEGQIQVRCECDIEEQSVNNFFEGFGVPFLHEDFLSYIKTLNETEKIKYEKYITERGDESKLIICSCVIMSWNDFIEMCDFIFGFYSFVFSKYNIKKERRDIVIFIQKKCLPSIQKSILKDWKALFNKPEENNFEYSEEYTGYEKTIFRLFAYIFEWLVSFWIKSNRPYFFIL